MEKSRKDRLLQSSRLVVRAGFVINRLFFIAVSFGLLLSSIFSAQFAQLLLSQTPAADVRSEATGLRLLMLLGIAMAVATDRLFTALAHMIASAGAGDSFSAANTRNLQTIGWSLLVLQLLDLPGALLDRFFPSLGSAAPDVTFSPGGWIAVLMVFVLCRVFAAGAAMRDDLEGTV